MRGENVIGSDAARALPSRARSCRTHLAVVATLAVLALAVVSVLPVASPAGAAVPTGISEDDCDALLSLGDEIPEVDGSRSADFDLEELAAAATGFSRTAAGVEDKKLKKSLKRLASIYGRMADADNVAEAVGIALGSGKKWSKSLATFGKASLECASSQVTIPTLPPDVTLPDGITLPRNLTIPSLPSR